MSENMDKDMNKNVELNDEAMEQATGGADDRASYHRFRVGNICWYSNRQKRVKILALTNDTYNKKPDYTVEWLDNHTVETHVEDGHLALMSEH